MLKHAGITAVAKEVPTRVLSNHDLEKMVDTNDEWITTRTGIKTRHLHDGPTSDLATGALEKALAARGMKADELDAIIVATATPDYIFPATACLVQDRVGASNAWSFDLSAACSGYLYGLFVAAQMIRTGAQRRIALIGADVMSSIIDYTSRDTCILFGDAAACTIVEAVDEPGVGEFFLRSNGGGGPMLSVPSSGSQLPPSAEAIANKQNYLQMQGREVFKHAVTGMSDACAKLLEREGLTGDDIDLMVAHQANKRILEAARARIDLPEEKVFINLDKYGNTTGASIPLCLAEAYEQGLLKPGNRVLLTAFGAGFTWGAGLLTWTLE